MPRTRKQRGGSIASDNVNALVAKSCSRFMYPTKIKAVMLNAQMHSSTPQQVGGGAEKAQVSWFYSHFVPYLTRSCTVNTTVEYLVAEMQHLWNTQNPRTTLSKRVAKQMLREFVMANQNTTNTEAYHNQVNIPLQWMNETVEPTSTYEMVGGASNCLYDTNYTVHNNDVYDRYRGNMGGSPPMGATVPANSFTRLYDWFTGKTTIFAPSTSNPTHQNQVQYLSQSGNEPIQVSTLHAHGDAQVPSTHSTTKRMNVFPTMTDNAVDHSSRNTPLARAGGRRRRGQRRVSRRKRVTNRM